MDQQQEINTSTVTTKRKRKISPVSVTVNDPTKVNTTNPPDLVDIKVTNPLVYIKYWWKKLMANEGIDVSIKAKPLTVFGIALIAFSLAFGLGGAVLPSFFPWVEFNNSPTSTAIASIPTPIALKDTALRGTLTMMESNPIRYYLITTSTEAVYLEIPSGFTLNNLVGKRIIAMGTYDSKNKILKVQDIKDLEVLSKTPVPIPTAAPTLKPTEMPYATPTPEVIIPIETPVSN